MSNSKRHINWACVWGGYRVVVYEGTKVLRDYSAGNHQGESQTYVDKGSRNAMRPEELRMLARRTVAEFRREYNVETADVQEDDDLAEGLLEELTSRWSAE
jgi:hypothetical protein